METKRGSIQPTIGEAESDGEPIGATHRKNGQPAAAPAGAGAGAGGPAGAGGTTGSVNDSTTSAPSQPQPRKRGRPAKIPQGEDTKIEFEKAQNVGEVGKPRSHHKRSRPKVDPEASSALLEMVELFAVATFGPEARLNDRERFLIEAPLSRMIAKYGDLADRYAGLIDPVMVGIGAVLYGYRISGVLAERQKSEAPPPEAPPANGATPSQKPGEPPSAPSLIFDLTGGAIPQ